MNVDVVVTGYSHNCKESAGVANLSATIKGERTYKMLDVTKNPSTDNEIQLLVLLEAFRTLKRDKLDVKVVLHNNYIYDGLTQYCPSWAFNNWKSNSKKTISHAHIWQELYSLINKHDVEYVLLQDKSMFKEHTKTAKELVNKLIGGN